MFKVISATFNDVSLDNDAYCSHEYVSLYDGSSLHEELLGKFCSIPSAPIMTTGPALFVEFKGRRENNIGRFSLSWTFANANKGKFISGHLLTNSCSENRY